MKQDYNLYLFLLEQMNCPKHCTWGKHQQVGNNCCFNRYIFSISVSSVPRLSHFPLCPVFKQFLDEVFVISGMIKVEVSVTSRAEGQGSTLTETLIIPEYHKKQNIITVLLCIVSNKKTTTNTPSHWTRFDIALGNHALRVQSAGAIMLIIIRCKIFLPFHWPKAHHVTCK